MAKQGADDEVTEHVRFKLPVAVFLVLRRGEYVMLLRRYNTGYHDGDYGLIAGHADGGEPFTSALCREAKEEAGIDINPADAHFAHVVHSSDPRDNKEYIHVFFAVTKWSGEPRNMEPHKCDELSWHPLDNLPDNVIPSVKTALENYRKGEYYTEFGW